jgi:hypothetical protein
MVEDYIGLALLSIVIQIMNVFYAHAQHTRNGVALMLSALFKEQLGVKKKSEQYGGH